MMSPVAVLIALPAAVSGCEPYETYNGSAHDEVKCWRELQDGLSRIAALERSASDPNLSETTDQSGTSPAWEPISTLGSLVFEGVKSPGQVLTASATILSLTVFGSLLGLRMVSRNGNGSGSRTLRAMFFCAMAIVAIHSYVLAKACCFELNRLELFLCVVMTAFFLLVVLVNYARMATEQSGIGRQR